MYNQDPNSKYKQRTTTRSCFPPSRVNVFYQVCLQLMIIQVNLAQQIRSSSENNNNNFRIITPTPPITTTTNRNHIPVGTTKTATSPTGAQRTPHLRQDNVVYPTGPGDEPSSPNTPPVSQQTTNEKRAFVIDLLRMLHEQYGVPPTKATTDKVRPIENRQSTALLSNGVMSQLIEAIGADGDVRRLIDWIRNSFTLASVGELTTQFVVSKLGSVNCAALLQPDREETLTPRFLLFNEHFVDVPFELSINPSANECLLNGKFDPQRKTVVLIHGYLAGYTLVDGITNIKNRILDLNKYANEHAMEAFMKASRNNGSYVLTDDLQLKVRQQLYNVIIVDWFNGANPVPRSNYIRAAVNAQVVGRLIARFLSALIVQCGTPASNLQIIAHSLGCHVSGFTGKELNMAGHRLGKITHLDPIGLCFGRLFSQPQLRLRPNDALETQAVHVSLNIFDNPLDGVHSNFLVNGGRDQIGCGGQSELKNSTASSVSLLFDPGSKFAPCSHLRALALFEEDLSSGQSNGQCQMVGYRCSSYDRFLAGKCGFCDSVNSQCRLMSLPPLSMQFRRLSLNDSMSSDDDNLYHRSQKSHLPSRVSAALELNSNKLQAASSDSNDNLGLLNYNNSSTLKYPQPHYTVGGVEDKMGTSSTSHHEASDSLANNPEEIMFGAPSNYLREQQTKLKQQLENNEIKRRSDRRLDQQGKRLVEVIGRIRQDTRTALAGGWTNLRSIREHQQLAMKANSGEHDDLQYQEATLALSHSEPDEQTTLPTATTLFSSTLPSSTQTVTTTMTTSTGHTFDTTRQSKDSVNRLNEDFVDQIPLGGQQIPRGALNGPLFFMGTSSLSPYCVNYYQFRVLIAESRLQRILKNQGLASNRLAPPVSHQSLSSSAISWQQRMSQGGARELLHLTVKLADTSGHFFKGFSMVENAKLLARVSNDVHLGTPPLPVPFAPVAASEPMAELTMLLNTTRTEPVRIGETIISYYFHSIVLADRVEVNYMSNISPEIRAKYSSVLCPIAINDRHQLVRYVECHKV